MMEGLSWLQLWFTSSKNCDFVVNDLLTARHSCTAARKGCATKLDHMISVRSYTMRLSDVLYVCLLTELVSPKANRRKRNLATKGWDRNKDRKSSPRHSCHHLRIRPILMRKNWRLLMCEYITQYYIAKKLIKRCLRSSISAKIIEATVRHNISSK